MTESEEAIIRDRFHNLLVEEGFKTHTTPPKGRSYSGSHVQTLWDFYLHATLAERNKCRYPDCQENEDERCVRWLTGECKGPNENGDPS